MRKRYALLAGMVLAPPIQAAAADAPTVVELYQSQGCSSCPPADAVLNALADRPDVLALNFAVTYWDRLGWKDSFAQPAFTRRQWDYANRAGRESVATPQMIINGTGVITGNRRSEVDAAIGRFARRSAGPAIGVEGRKVTVAAGAAAGPSTLWLVRYDTRTIAVPIGAGENAGRTLPHRNVVRELISLGTWKGRAMQFALPASKGHLAAAVLLQQGSGGPILAARKL